MRSPRTQADRSATTRAALLEATIASVLEDGYTHATTARIADRAGVSRGAHTHHFGTRQALVTAAIEYLWTRWGKELLDASAALPADASDVDIEMSLDLLWASFSSPLFYATLELWVHARTDPELHQHLTTVEHGLDRIIMDLAPRFLPTIVGHADFEHLVGLITASMRGLALLDVLEPDTSRSRQQWPFCRSSLATLIRAADEEGA